VLSVETLGLLCRLWGEAPSTRVLPVSAVMPAFGALWVGRALPMPEALWGPGSVLIVVYGKARVARGTTDWGP
jgi:hypothetical protein